MLEQMHDTLWVAEGEIVSFFGIPYPTRSVIVRLQNGDLWVWSPVKLSPGLPAEVDRLGPVRHLVSPNKLHHLYLKEWKVAYPKAQLWGPQSTIRKRPDLTFREALQDSPPLEWRPDIDQAWFRGSFAMDEIVFCHRPSATAIVADLISDIQRSFSARTLGMVAIPGATGRAYPGSSLCPAGMAFVVHQPRTGAPGARQGTELELRARDRRPRRVLAFERRGFACQVVPLARRLIGYWTAASGGAPL